MSDPMQKSLQGHSQFVTFNASTSMEQSLCGVSQKIPIDNASLLNRQQLQRDKKELLRMGLANKSKHPKQSKIKQQIQQQEQQSANEFLNVGKWNIEKSRKTGSKLVTDGSSPSNSHKNESKQPMQNQNLQKSFKKKGVNSKALQSQQLNQYDKGMVSQSKVNEKIIDKQNKSKLDKKDKGSHLNKTQTENKEHQHQQKLNRTDFSHKSTKPLTKPQQPHWHPHGAHKHQQEQVQEQLEQPQDQEQEDQEQSEQESEEESSSEQQEEEDQEQQEDQQQQDQEDEKSEDKGWDQQQEPQEEQQEEVQDKFITGLQDEQESSQALQTEIANTEELNESRKPSKWAKKKPLETMTKYETKILETEAQKKGYHSRLDSASFTRNQQQDQQVMQNLQQQPSEEWAKVQRVLLRLKLIIG